MLVELTNSNFEEEVLKSELPVLVDFWASWCVPCRMIGPAIKKAAKELEGKVKFGKVNVENEKVLSVTYSIQTIPSLVIFKDGKIVDSAVGFMTKIRY